MGHDIDFLFIRAIGSDHFVQRGIVGDPIWIKRGDLGSDADDLDMIDLANLLDDRLQFASGHDHRIPAGQQNVGYLGMLTYISEALSDVFCNLLIFVHK